MELLDKIHSNPINISVLKLFEEKKFNLGILIHKSEKTGYTHEGLEDFLNLAVPEEIKFIWGTIGVMINPKSGEIIAFSFNRSDIALKLNNPSQYNGCYSHIRKGLITKWKFRDALKVSLRYFSNIWGDEDTIVDLRALDNNWAYSLYLLDDCENEINEYYNQT